MRPVLYLVAVVVVVASGVWRLVDRDDGPPAICAVFDAHPVGVDGIRWADGTITEGTWLNVLTDGVQQTAPDERADLAAAVVADDEGYERVIDELSETAAAAARRLHDRLTDASATPAAVDLVDADVDDLRSARRGCPGVP